jgi:hypothetical protein
MKSLRNSTSAPANDGQTLFLIANPWTSLAEHTTLLTGSPARHRPQGAGHPHDEEPLPDARSLPRSAAGWGEAQ